MRIPNGVKESHCSELSAKNSNSPVTSVRFLQEKIVEIRDRMVLKGDPKEYVSSWTEKELFRGREENVIVLILRTSGCSWALKCGCTMCGYLTDSAPEADANDIIHQFNNAVQRWRGESVVKLFTSGSFFDEREIPKKARDWLLSNLNGMAEKVVVESRAEHISKEKLEEAKKLFNGLEVAVGLEAADDTVLEYSVNKGSCVKDYVRAAEIVTGCGISLRSYLLIKPPFLTEREGIESAVQSAEFASKWSQVISFNPVNVQNFTLVEHLWRRGEYRPPWLWSVVEVLKRSAEKCSSSQIISSPTGGGSKRGAHNCGKCDQGVLKAIRDFSLTQDIKLLDSASCECRERWLDILETESFCQGAVGLERFIIGKME